MYIYIHTHICVYTHIYIYIYKCIHIYMCVYTHTTRCYCRCQDRYSPAHMPCRLVRNGPAKAAVGWRPPASTSPRARPLRPRWVAICIYVCIYVCENLRWVLSNLISNLCMPSPQPRLLHCRLALPCNPHTVIAQIREELRIPSVSSVRESCRVGPQMADWRWEVSDKLNARLCLFNKRRVTQAGRTPH